MDHKAEIDQYKAMKRNSINAMAGLGMYCERRIYPTMIAHAVAVAVNAQPLPIIEFWLDQRVNAPRRRFTQRSNNY